MSNQKKKETTNEVMIQLTEEQRDQIQKVTGKLVTELKVATLEDRANPAMGIPPDESALNVNHNETLIADEIELSVEEMEEVVAPGLISNHNETLVTDEIELDVEVMEEVIAPALTNNHNETLITDEIELSVEEMEEVVAPGVIVHQ